jgi:hypothetical protein
MRRAWERALANGFTPRELCDLAGRLKLIQPKHSEERFRLNKVERRVLVEKLIRAGERKRGDHRVIGMAQSTWNQLARQVKQTDFGGEKPHGNAGSRDACSPNGRPALDPLDSPEQARLRALEAELAELEDSYDFESAKPPHYEVTDPRIVELVEQVAECSLALDADLRVGDRVRLRGASARGEIKRNNGSSFEVRFDTGARSTIGAYDLVREDEPHEAEAELNAGHVVGSLGFPRPTLNQLLACAKRYGRTKDDFHCILQTGREALAAHEFGVLEGAYKAAKVRGKSKVRRTR